MSHSLERFKNAQEEYFDIALNELLKGKKEEHWIWFIFPQIKGLGMSSRSHYYGIDNIDEAKRYYQDELLKSRLEKVCNVILSYDTNDLSEVMDYPDDMKVKSSMTLFYLATKNDLFKNVLDKFFDGEMDEQTIKIIR